MGLGFSLFIGTGLTNLKAQQSLPQSPSQIVVIAGGAFAANGGDPRFSTSFSNCCFCQKDFFSNFQQRVLFCFLCCECHRLCWSTGWLLHCFWRIFSCKCSNWSELGTSWSVLELGLHSRRFRHIEMGFERLKERHFVGRPMWLHLVLPRSAPRLFSSWWRTADVDHWNDLHRSHWWLFNLLTRDDKCLSCVDYFLVLRRPTVMFQHEGVPHVCHLPPWGSFVHQHRHVFARAVDCRRSTLSTYCSHPEILNIHIISQLLMGITLAGITRVLASTSGDSFSLLCLILHTDWTSYSFIQTLRII